MSATRQSKAKLLRPISFKLIGFAILLLQDSTFVGVIADNLDLSPYCSTAAMGQGCRPVYTLTAVTKHHGRSIASGHYTAQCRSGVNDAWYHCNDSSVSPDKGLEGPADSAYILFYRLQDQGQDYC